MARNAVFEKLLTDFNKGFFAGSQAKFSKKAGVSAKLVNSWLNGKNIPSPVNMEKLAKILKKDLKEIQEIFSIENQSRKASEEEAVDLNAISDLIKRQNKIIEENNKRTQMEISLLKKDNEIFKKEMKSLNRKISAALNND